eukprot:2728253-Prymnesium_polylepis.2
MAHPYALIWHTVAVEQATRLAKVVLRSRRGCQRCRPCSGRRTCERVGSLHVWCIKPEPEPEPHSVPHPSVSPQPSRGPHEAY